MNLVVAPNPVLQSKAVDWDFNSDTNTADLEKEMIEIMQASNGIGLAANQVGLLSRVFVIQLLKHPTINKPFAMFNPEVIATSDEIQNGEEGCLSFPDLFLEVKRPQEIVSKYFDNTGKECTITLTDIDARCFLHELDHLNGVCFTEKVSALKLAFAIKKQRKQNGRTKR
jgi:peptide deformylase